MVPIAARNLTRGTTLASAVEVASSFWARFLGLMGRRPLPPGAGLWIPATNGIHMFFMRFAIDAVFLGRPMAAPGESGAASGEANEVADARNVRPVVGLRRALPPWVGLVPLVRGADGVLELPVGAIAASGTEVGDIVVVG